MADQCIFCRIARREMPAGEQEKKIGKFINELQKAITDNIVTEVRKLCAF